MDSFIQRTFPFFDTICFQQVPFLDIVEAFQTDTAFEALADFAGIVLASFE